MFYIWKFNFVLFLNHFLVNISTAIDKLFQCCFLNVEVTPMNIRWLNFYFYPNINVEEALVHRHWIDIILSMLFQRCFANVETTSINIRRINFHFQPYINVDVFAGMLHKIVRFPWPLVFTPSDRLNKVSNDLVPVLCGYTKKRLWDLDTAKCGNKMNCFILSWPQIYKSLKLFMI